MNLSEAVAKLRANVAVIDMERLTLTPPNAWCDFEHEGLPFRACFTKSTVHDCTVYMLSLSKRNAVPDGRGMSLPTEEEGADLARVFFPKGCVAVASEDDLLKASRKYIALRL